MKKFLSLLLFVAAIFVVSGCGREEPTITDEEAIRSIVDASDWCNLTKHEENDSSAASSIKGDSLIGNPLWWRAIPADGRTRQLDIDVVGDSAYVIRTVHATGKFNIIGRKVDSTWFAGSKSLKDTRVMHAIFKRTGSANDANRGWELKKLSGAIGYSDSIHTVQIDSVRIQCTHYPDTVLTNPLGYLFNKENAFSFTAGEAVTVTLYTNTNDAKAFLHVFQPNFPHHRRIPMQNNGDGTYTNMTPWYVQIIPAVRFAVFDLLRYDTIHDTEYAYDFDGWFYPYLVE